MAKVKQKLIQSIYKEVEKHRKGKIIIGNPNTLTQMKNGDINPTIKSIANLLIDNEMGASITLNYAGTTTTFNFANYQEDFRKK